MVAVLNLNISIPIILFSLVLLLSIPAAYAQEMPPLEQTTKKYSKMDSRLADLYESVSAKITYLQSDSAQSQDNQRVQVILEMISADAPIPQNLGIEVETTYENLVQATVPVRNLEAIASDDNVRFIKMPSRPVADIVPSPLADNSTADHSYLVLIPVIALFLVMIFFVAKKKGVLKN